MADSQSAQPNASWLGQIDAVLFPWGFQFAAEERRTSHSGDFMSGHYVRNNTRIGLSWRTTLDNVYYEHTFATEHSSHRELERFTVGHATLMHGVGHGNDSRLISVTEPPDNIVARNGGDRIAAWVHDLREYAAPVLAAPCDKLFEIVRQGRRTYSVDYPDPSLMTYDDDIALTDYVWRHHRDRFTDEELMIGRVILGMTKAQNASSKQVAMRIREKFGIDSNNPIIVAALADGVEAFRKRVRDRVLCEHARKIRVNRCPACERVVRTPLAQQCLWCGHDWHGRR